MSSKQFHSGPRAGIQPRRSLVPCVLVAGLVLLIPASAFNDGAGFTGGGDGDAVGSLPSSFGGGHGAGQHGVSEEYSDQFGLSLVLAESQLPALITHAVLEGSYRRESLSTPGLVRISFACNATIELDRALFEASFVSVQLELGPTFGGGLLSIDVADKKSLHAIQPGSLPLHLQQLSWNHLLERGVTVRGTTPQGESRTLSISTRGTQAELIVLQLKD